MDKPIIALEDIQQRKAQLENNMKQQRQRMTDLVVDLKDDFTPSSLFKGTVSGFLSPTNVQALTSPAVMQNLGHAAQFLMRRRNLSPLIRLAIPAILFLAPKVYRMAQPHLPTREEVSNFFNSISYRLKTAIRLVIH
jgi:hypothetical protein